MTIPMSGAEGGWVGEWLLPSSAADRVYKEEIKEEQNQEKVC